MFTELCAGKHQLRAFTENSITEEFLTYTVCPDEVRLKATKQSMLCTLQVY